MNRIPMNNMNELYQDRSLYSSPDMFSPPSERLSHVIRFELTTGCSWARCTYCGGYNGIKHSIRSMDEYKEHVEKVWRRIGKGSSLAKSLRRIFIGGGNALEVETEMLNEALQHTAERFTENTGRHPKRIALYGRTADILNHDIEGLKKLCYENEIGLNLYNSTGMAPDRLNLIYWGVESGSSEVLNYVNKGCSQSDMFIASNIIKRSGVETSVMVMPGLGGKRFYDEHVRKTANLLGDIEPSFITFMGTNPLPDSRYYKIMMEEEEKGKNRSLTDREMAEQMLEIIRSMPNFNTKIGCFDASIDKVGYNPLTFGSFNISFNIFYNKGVLARKLKKEIKRLYPDSGKTKKFFGLFNLKLFN